MSRLNSTANVYEHFAYESSYQLGDWDVIPESYGKVANKPTLRIVENNEQQVVKRVHPETLRKRRKAILFCAMIVLAFSMLVAVVYRYAVISEMHIKSAKQQEEIDELSEQISTLEVKVNTSRNLGSIMNRAEELGMDFAVSENIHYIELNYE